MVARGFTRHALPIEGRGPLMVAQISRHAGEIGERHGLSGWRTDLAPEPKRFALDRFSAHMVAPTVKLATEAPERPGEPAARAEGAEARHGALSAGNGGIV